MRKSRAGQSTLRHRQATSLASRSAMVPWTQAEIERLAHLHFDEGMGAAEIVHTGDLPGRSRGAVQSKIGELQGRKYSSTGARAVASNAAIIDREKRARAAQHQSIVGMLMGDPLPGFSMLDRKR